ncbi:hypothetical protein FRC0429_02059 [Corynebacterium diphtheriae]|nr:hypothetical protein FRC0022_02006 [Corynebacterium diphtheriae]CAB0917736.1 hypothetical protein FRC0429_02059 [Corynebacterium diphtheriae]
MSLNAPRLRLRFPRLTWQWRGIEVITVSGGSGGDR